MDGREIYNSETWRGFWENWAKKADEWLMKKNRFFEFVMSTNEKAESVNLSNKSCDDPNICTKKVN